MSEMSGFVDDVKVDNLKRVLLFFGFGNEFLV